jgi:aspartate kinase
MLLHVGEIVSVALLSMALQAIGVPAISLTSFQTGIVTDGFHTNARIQDIEPKKIRQALAEKKVVLVSGFQGVSSDAEITTLGRGGSDTTAIALAAKLKANLCEIYSDVNGIFTADPRIIRKAQLVKVCTFDEVLELSCLGAQVLHDRAVDLGKTFNVPIHVRSSFNHQQGTLIQKERLMEKSSITGITSDKKITKVSLLGVRDVPGIAAKLFTMLGDLRIPVQMVVQAQGRNGCNDIIFTLHDEGAEKIKGISPRILSVLKAQEILIDSKVASVSVVGEGLATAVGIQGEIFSILGKKKINIDLISSSRISVTVVVAESAADKAVKALHQGLVEDSKWSK